MSLVGVLLSRYRNLLQLILLLVNIFVLLCGLSIMAVGIKVLASNRQYLSITVGDDTELNRFPTSIAAIGVVVAALGLLGVVGGILARNVFGLILLGSYTFVLALVIMSEVGSGIAAVTFADRVRDEYLESANRSLALYNCSTDSTKEEWDKFQKEHHCCGSTNYTSYKHYVFTDTGRVPKSCCNMTAINASHNNCTEVSSNPTDYSQYIYTRGCPDAFAEELEKSIDMIAVVVLVIGLAQLVGVVMGSIVAYTHSREEHKTHPYQRLKQSV